MTALRRYKPTGRHWRATIAALFLVGAAVYFAPHLAARTGLRHAIVRAAAPRYQGELTVGSATFDWFSPVVLREIRAVGEDRQPLLEVKRVASDKSLGALMLNRASLGALVVEKPVLHLLVRDDGTNVEDALEQILSADSDQSLDCSVRIVDGAIEARKDAGGDGAPAAIWRLHDLQARIASPKKNELRAKLTGLAEEARGTQGRIDAELWWKPSEEGWGRGELAIEMSDAPLGIARELIRRLGHDARLAGRLSAAGKLTWEDGDDAAPDWSLEVAQASLRQFSLASPRFLGSDQLHIETLAGHGAVAWNDRRLAVQGVEAECELGRLQAHGTADWRTLKEHPHWTGRLAAWSDDSRLSGELDLARLARVLPHTLRIREQTRITSGVISANLSCQKAGEERRWQGVLSTANLSAVNNGKAVTWEKPIVVTASLRRAPDGLTLESIDCRSSFLEIAGRGDAASGDFVARGDLDRLAAELGQFVDLDPLRMAGKLELAGSWRQLADGRLEAKADAKIESLELAAPNWRPWREERLVMVASASGSYENQRLSRVDEGSLAIEAGEDKLHLRLTGPVASPGAAAIWPLECKLTGELATWLPRIQTVAPLEGWAVRGAVNLTASLTADSQRIEVQSATAQIDQLQARTQRLLIFEPRVNLEASGAWHRGTRVLTCPSATLRSATVALRGEQLAIGIGSASPTLAGAVSYRGDVFRLLNWLHLEAEPPVRQWAGEFTGAVTVSRKEKSATIDWTTNFNNLALLERMTVRPASFLSGAVQPGTVAPQWRPILREPNVAIAAKAELLDDQPMVDCQSFTASGFGWSVESQGKLAWPSDSPRVDVQGRLRYDLAVISEKLRPLVGGEFRAEGQENRTFALRGPVWELIEKPPVPSRPPSLVSNASAPLAPSYEQSPEKLLVISRELTGDGAVGWTSASLYGVSLGPGALVGKLSQGVVLFDPLEASMGEGRLKVQPRIDFYRSPATIELASGRIAEQVAITPEMCHSWLKYVAPLAADATRAQGKFSLDLTTGSAPLSQPRLMTAAGVFTLHGADLGPGPLAEQILGIAHQIKALVERKPSATPVNISSEWLRLREQQIPFQVEQGRVYHQGLEVSAGDVVIRTQGAVGLDQSLEILAEAPIQDHWIAKQPLLAGLKGQTLKIPIRGALTRPVLDNRALEDLSRQLVGSAAERLLQEELSKGLNRLLGPRK